MSLVAYIDRTGADFELRSAVLQGGGRACHGQPAVADAPGEGLHRVRSERHFQLKVENTWEHNAREVAEALAACQAETGGRPADPVR